MKIGRNKPCPCGSGLKYKACHYQIETAGRMPISLQGLEYTNLVGALERETLEIRERQERLRSLGIFIDFVKPVIFQEKKVWALGNRIYPNRPPNQTFHEFIIETLRELLGKEWWERQCRLPDIDQHFIFRCFIKHQEWKSKNERPENRLEEMWRALPDGYSRTLAALAFDVCSLMHAVHLPEVFLKKLRNNSDYQGVRYEIAVAAIFARLGYLITFLDEKYEGLKNQPKHSEFLAAKKQTNEEIYVEVKSKVRDGVLHELGTFEEKRELKSSVSSLYKDALKQKTFGKPFIIFINLNLPPSDGKNPNEIEWLKEITKMRDRQVFATKDQPSPANAIIFSNWSYHFGTDQVTGIGELLLEICKNPADPINVVRFFDDLMSGLTAYGKVPNIDMSIDV